MWNKPGQQLLDSIPRIYETENIPVDEKQVYFHFWIFGFDWFIVEYDGEDSMFGYAILNEDWSNAEWGYISFSELKSIRHGGVEVDRDIHWSIRPFKKVIAERKLLR